MNGIYFLAYAVLYSAEPVVWMTVFQKLFILQRQKRFAGIAGIIIYLAIFAKQYNFFLQGNTIVTFLFIPFFMVYLFFMIHFLYKTSITEGIICVAFVVLFSTLADVLAFGTCNIFFSVSQRNILRKAGLKNICCTLFSKVYLIVLYLLFFMRKTSKQAYEVIVRQKAMVYMIPNIAGITFFYIILHTTNVTGSHYLMLLLLFLVDVIFMFFTAIHLYVEEVLSKEKKEQEIRLRLHAVEQELELYEEIEKSKQELRKLRHDMGEHLEILNHFCERKNCKEAREYVKQISGTVKKAQDIYLLKDTKVAVLLKIKKKTAKEHGIIFRTMITTEQFNMKDMDICSLLSNLLNNAEEAVEKQPEERRKFIRLVIERVRHGCRILCENSMESQPIVKNGMILTTKENQKEHGLGIQIIKDIVKKYDGSVRFEYGKEIFSVEIFVKDTNRGREEEDNDRE